MSPRLRSLAALLLLAAPAATSAVAGAQGAARRHPGTAAMARIPAGSYRPLYVAGGSGRVRVKGFALDRQPVTRGEFAEFVRGHEEWRRGKVGRALAEPLYLRSWPGALAAGGDDDLRRPVTEVSWYAASAYCTARGKRLPTLDEWEYAAAANETLRDATADPASRRRLLALYAAGRAAPLPRSGSGAPNVYGVRDLHGSVWEWTLDSGPHAAHAHLGKADHPINCASTAIGAADPGNYAAFLRFAIRSALTPRTTLERLGFRCAADLSSS
jgi:formylglycine-generating enzyme required for sulfatase activity